MIAAGSRAKSSRPHATCTGRGGKCRSPVSRILSTPCEAGRPFLSPRRSGAPCLRRVRLIPGNERAGSPFPVLSCTTRGLPCRPVTRIRGGLLLHHFTLACDLAAHRRYLSAALIRPGSSRYPSPAFARRVALWCPDFPHLPLARKLRPSGERRAETVPLRMIVQPKTARTSEIAWCQACMLRDPRQHPRSDFLGPISSPS